MTKRRKIPDRVKLHAALRAMGLTIEKVQFDHHPPLAMRPVDPDTGDTVPPANDPEYVFMLTLGEHRTKTFGPGGEKRITTAGSDIGNIAKTRRLAQQQEEFRRRVLRGGEVRPPPTRKRKISSRPFPKRPGA